MECDAWRRDASWSWLLGALRSAEVTITPFTVSLLMLTGDIEQRLRHIWRYVKLQDLQRLERVQIVL